MIESVRCYLGDSVNHLFVLGCTTSGLWGSRSCANLKTLPLLCVQQPLRVTFGVRRYVCNTGFCFLITAIFKSTILWVNLMWCEILRINPVFCEVTTVDFEPKQRSYSKKTQQQRKLLVYTYNLLRAMSSTPNNGCLGQNPKSGISDYFWISNRELPHPSFTSGPTCRVPLMYR